MADAIFEPRWWALLKYLPQIRVCVASFLILNKPYCYKTCFDLVSLSLSLSSLFFSLTFSGRCRLHSYTHTQHPYIYISSKYYRPLSYYGKIETSDNKNQTNVNRRPRGGLCERGVCGRCADPLRHHHEKTLLNVPYPRYRKICFLLSFKTVHASTYRNANPFYQQRHRRMHEFDVHLRALFFLLLFFSFFFFLKRKRLPIDKKFGVIFGED